MNDLFLLPKVSSFVCRSRIEKSITAMRTFHPVFTGDPFQAWDMVPTYD
jgi:hypothetical protein